MRPKAAIKAVIFMRKPNLFFVSAAVVIAYYSKSPYQVHEILIIFITKLTINSPPIALATTAHPSIIPDMVNSD